MSKKNNDTKGESTEDNNGTIETNTPTPEPSVTLVTFCDHQSVNEVDRNAVYMQYGKLTQKTNTEWLGLLSGKITLKS